MITLSHFNGIFQARIMISGWVLTGKAGTAAGALEELDVEARRRHLEPVSDKYPVKKIGLWTKEEEQENAN